MASQPARKLIRAPRDFAVKPYSSDAAEIVPMGRGCLARQQGRDHAQVNTADILPVR